MRIFIPSKKIILFYLILLPIVVINFILIYIAASNQNQVLLNIATIVILIIFLVISFYTRIVSKDRIIFELRNFRFGSKDQKIDLIRLIFLQYEKHMIEYKEIKRIDLDLESNKLEVVLEFEMISIDLKNYIKKDMIRIKEELTKRMINNG